MKTQKWGDVRWRYVGLNLDVRLSRARRHAYRRAGVGVGRYMHVYIEGSDPYCIKVRIVPERILRPYLYSLLRVHVPSMHVDPYVPAAAYREKRENVKRGGVIPGDGKYTWTKGRVAYDHIFGVKERDGYYHCVLRYDEGPKDKEFMEEGDWAYIQGLWCEGKLLEKEPNADKEIASDHKYRAEITWAVNCARAGFRDFVVAARMAVEQFEQAVEKLTMPDRAKVKARDDLRTALNRATKDKDEELLTMCRSVLEQLTERYSEDKRNANTKLLMAILKDLLDKHERREILLASERQVEREAKVRTNKDQTQECLREAIALSDTINQIAAQAARHIEQAQQCASKVKDPDVDRLVELINQAEAKRKKLFADAMRALELIKTKADEAHAAYQRLEIRIRASDFLEVNAVELAIAGDKAVAEASQANKTIQNACHLSVGQGAKIAEINEKIIQIVALLLGKETQLPTPIPGLPH